ncbi:Two-component system sensor histidine kinase/response [Indibacter alkaliphilus LW1]|uniref:histidine kinase n=2 Tax=Indibacter TaxID=647744 RepID=S2DLK8_INDAL|nr:Two-component system sensor histidine kinase/response [Indibacter alkaliphilus LW1]
MLSEGVKGLIGLIWFCFEVNAFVLGQEQQGSYTFPLIKVGTEEELYSKYIHSIAEAKNNDIILGAFGPQLIVYNGIDIETMDLGSEVQQSFNLGACGERVLVSSANKLFLKAVHSGKSELIFEGQSNIELHVTDVSNPLFSDADKLYRVDEIGGIELLKAFPKANIRQVLYLENNKYLVVTDDENLYILDGESEEVLKIGAGVRAILNSSHEIFLVYRDRVQLFDRASGGIGFKVSERGFSEIQAWASGSEAAWIIANNNLYQLNKNGIAKLTLKAEEPILNLAAIWESRDGTLWIGTYGQGLYKLYDLHIRELYFQGQSMGNVNSLFQLPESTSFVFASAKGLFINDSGRIKKIKIPEMQYFSVAPFSSHELILAGQEYLVLKNLKTDEITLFTNPLLEESEVNILQKSEMGLFVGTQRGLFLFDLNLRKSNEIRSSQGHRLSQVSQIEILDSGEIVILESGELFEIRGESAFKISIDTEDLNFLVLKNAGNHLLWAAGSQGKALLIDVKEQSVNRVLNSKRAKNIFSLAINSQDELILGTERGVELHSNSGILYYDDRISFLESNLNAMLINDDGNLLFGTVNGLMELGKDYQLKKRAGPRLSNLQINGEEVYPSLQFLNLAYGQQSLYFKAIMNDYIRGRDCLMEYRLDYFDQEWVKAERGTGVQFTNLPSGKYQIEVKASHFQGDVSYYKFPLVIVVAKPFWKEWWFLIMVVLAGGLLIILGYFWFQRKTIRKNLKLSRLVAERTREIEEINKGLENTIKARTSELNHKNRALETAIGKQERIMAFVGLISSNSQDIVCLLDRSRKIVLISESVKTILGHASRDLRGMDINEVFPGLLQVEEWNSELFSQQVPMTFRTFSPKGELLVLETIGKKILNHEAGFDQGYVLNVRNVTEREVLKSEIQSIYRNIHRDFHDEVGNKLARIIALVSVLKLQVQAGECPGITMDRIESAAKSLYGDTKDFIWSLDTSNNTLESLGLQLRDFGVHLFEGSGIDFHFKINLEKDMPLAPNLVRDLMLLVKELLTNVLKHSHGRFCQLMVLQKEKHLLFLVKDDGIGLSPADRKGNGLKNLHFRSGRCKGELLIKSRNGTLMGIRVKASSH